MASTGRAGIVATGAYSHLSQEDPSREKRDSVFESRCLHGPAVVTDHAFPLRPGNAPGFLPHTRGPRHSNEDFGIIKNTYVTERTSLQFRADMFNLFNRVGLGDPDTDLADGPGTFGVIFDPVHGGRVSTRVAVNF